MLKEIKALIKEYENYKGKAFLLFKVDFECIALDGKKVKTCYYDTIYTTHQGVLIAVSPLGNYNIIPYKSIVDISLVEDFYND